MPRKVMRIFLLLMFILLFSTFSFAQNQSCGNSDVKIEKIGEWESTRFIITANNNTHDTKLILNSVDYVNFSCESNKRSQSKIVIRAICGGSGCSESTYIVIDSRTLMVELIPFQGQGNLDLVEKILGRKLKE